MHSLALHDIQGHLPFVAQHAPNISGEVLNRWGQPMVPRVGSKGFLTVAPRVGGVQVRLYVHILAALAHHFEGYVLGAVPMHVDGDKANNRAENIQWSVPVERCPTCHQIIQNNA